MPPQNPWIWESEPPKRERDKRMEEHEGNGRQKRKSREKGKDGERKGTRFHTSKCFLTLSQLLLEFRRLRKTQLFC